MLRMRIQSIDDGTQTQTRNLSNLTSRPHRAISRTLKTRPRILSALPIQYTATSRGTHAETPKRTPTIRPQTQTHHPQTPTRWVSKRYPANTQNAPKPNKPCQRAWCGRRDSDPGRWLSPHQRMEGHWTLNYVLDQARLRPHTH